MERETNTGETLDDRRAFAEALHEFRAKKLGQYFNELSGVNQMPFGD